MHWFDIPATIDAWVEKVAAPGYDVRQEAAGTITASHVGYYVDPETSRVGIFAGMAAPDDRERVKRAAHRATGSEPLFLTYQELADPAGTWVKVAHSPALRRAGELLNFFPGQYAEGVPNAPSPVAAMLTSGLIGAGLGYGGGRLVGAFMPEGYGKRLGRTGLLLGGALGMAPGLAWGGVNKLDGRRFNDPGLLDGDPADTYATAMDGTNAPQHPPAPAGGNPIQSAIESAQHTLHNAPLHRLKFGNAVDDVVLGAWYTAAAEKAASAFGTPDLRESHPADVNIDALGRTLWDAGASPNLAATTMAGMYAAQQLPDPHARPGWATGNQLGQLAANAAGDYASGYLAGAAINTLIGTPYRASTFGGGAAVLGVLGAVVPKLFGR
jgi:hypothetical protein